MRFACLVHLVRLIRVELESIRKSLRCGGDRIIVTESDHLTAHTFTVCIGFRAV